MKLKRPIEDVRWEIHARANSVARSALNNLIPQNYGNPMSSVMDAMTQAIAMAVSEGFKTMMENQYTDEDFERDLDLK